MTRGRCTGCAWRRPARPQAHGSRGERGDRCRPGRSVDRRPGRHVRSADGRDGATDDGEHGGTGDPADHELQARRATRPVDNAGSNGIVPLAHLAGRPTSTNIVGIRRGIRVGGVPCRVCHISWPHIARFVTSSRGRWPLRTRQHVRGTVAPRRPEGYGASVRGSLRCSVVIIAGLRLLDRRVGRSYLLPGTPSIAAGRSRTHRTEPRRRPGRNSCSSDRSRLRAAGRS